jgi:hypothetical protein
MIPSSQPSTRSKSDIPSTQYPPPLFQSGGTKPRYGEVRPSLQTLQAENERLQALLSEVTAKLSKAEEVIRAQQEQEQAVRDGVMMVRREVSVRPINTFMNVLLRYAFSCVGFNICLCLSARHNVLWQLHYLLEETIQYSHTCRSPSKPLSWDLLTFHRLHHHIYTLPRRRRRSLRPYRYLTLRSI